MGGFTNQPQAPAKPKNYNMHPLAYAIRVTLYGIHGLYNPYPN